MPPLANRRHNWFASLRAQGMRLEEAYERAGYVPDRGHACRLASREDVAQRINELRSDYREAATAEAPLVIDALMAIGQSCRELGTPMSLKEARFAYLEAARLQQRMAEDLAQDRELIERELSRMGLKTPRGGRAEAKEEAKDEPEAETTAPAPAPVDLEATAG